MRSIQLPPPDLAEMMWSPSLWDSERAGPPGLEGVCPGQFIAIRSQEPLWTVEPKPDIQVGPLEGLPGEPAVTDYGR